MKPRMQWQWTAKAWTEMSVTVVPNDRCCSSSARTLDEFGLQPGQVRENITVAGLPLAGTTAGTRLQVGDTVMEVTMDCAPCEFMNELKPGLREEIDGRRGTLCKVISGGEIKVGDGLQPCSNPKSLTAHH